MLYLFYSPESFGWYAVQSEFI